MMIASTTTPMIFRVTRTNRGSFIATDVPGFPWRSKNQKELKCCEFVPCFITLLFAQAELAEDRVEQVFRCRLAHNFTDGMN